MTKAKLIILAAFWNDEDWLPVSLQQMKLINADEVLISEGCFDIRKQRESSDQTVSLLQRFISEDPAKFKLFKAIRAKNRIHSILLQLRYPFFSVSPARLFRILLSLKKNMYRVNQSITFNFLISESTQWKKDNWFMTYDSDQYYSDSLIQIMKKRIFPNLPVVPAIEMTFFDSLKKFTTEFEQRYWSNMPHRIGKYTLIHPTREIVNEFFLYFQRSNKLTDNQLSDPEQYFHFKFSTKRFFDGYSLGDRKAPASRKYKTKNTLKLPKVIEMNISYLKSKFSLN